MSFDAIYDVSPVECGEWKGFRVMSHEDVVYTAVTDGEADARLYGDPRDGWTAAVRFPVTDDDEAYEVWDETATSLTPEGSALHVDGLTFQEEREDGLERTDDGYTLRYNPEGEAAVPEYSYEGFDSGSLAEAGIFFGWIPGFAGGIAADPSGTGAGPAILAGTWIGMMGGLPALNYAVTKTAGTVNTWRSKRKYGDPDRLQDASLLQQVNERNALEQYLEEEGFDSTYGETYEELAEKDLDTTLRQLTGTHFDRFDEQQGVIVSTETDTYRDAATLLSTVTPYQDERPRVTTDPDAFHSIFPHFVQEGTVLEEGRALVRRTVEEGAHPDIETFLDTEYEDVVREVGAETRLND